MISSTTVGTLLLNTRGRISQPLSHCAVAGDAGTYHIDQHCNISTPLTTQVLRVSEAWL